MLTENCSCHKHRLRNAKINSEKTPVLNYCSERWHILRGTQFTLALSASRSQQTDSLPYYIIIKAVMVVGLRITRLSEEVTSAVNEKYMNALKKKKLGCYFSPLSYPLSSCARWFMFFPYCPLSFPFSSSSQRCPLALD